ncbi:MAG: tetratricopeptide repeat protein [Phycisphaerales bacterium]|nr:tetratricopeptide repeat protein [Phycisphaerales bacterium]
MPDALSSSGSAGQVPSGGGPAGVAFAPVRFKRAVPWRQMGMGLILSLAMLLVCARALDGYFMWKDWSRLLNNPLVLNEGGILDAWTSPYQHSFAPLATSVSWLEYHGFLAAQRGLNKPGSKVLLSPVPFHVVNLLLGMATAVLFWLILRRLTVPGSFAAALIFAVHPMTVETVLYLSALPILLAVAMTLAALLIFVYWLDEARSGRYLAILGFSVAAFLCSPVVAAAGPLLMLLMVGWRRAQDSRGRTVALVPLVLIALGAVAAQAWMSLSATRWLVMPWNLRLAHAGGAFWFYLFKLILPFHVVPMYSPWPGSVTATGYLPLVGALALLLVLWRLGKQRGGVWRGAFFGAAAYAVALLPVTGLVNLPTFLVSPVANRLAYLAIMPAVAVICGLFGRWRLRSQVGGRVAVELAALAVVLALGIASFTNAGYYRSPIKLWKHVLKVNPDAWAAHDNLAEQYFLLEGQINLARQELQQAIRINPDDAYARLHLALWDEQVGANADALAQIQTMLANHPQNAQALAELADYEFARHEYVQAAKHALTAVQIDPTSELGNRTLANVLRFRHDLKDAIHYLKMAVRWHPNDISLHTTLIEWLLENGNKREALAQAQLLAGEFPDDAAKQRMLIGLELALGDASAADRTYHRLVAQHPNDALLQYQYANALDNQNFFTRAIEHYRAAVRLEPKVLDFRFNLATALLDHGETAAGKAELNKVFAMAPHDPQWRVRYALYFLDHHNVAAALEQYKLAVGLQPRNPAVRFAWAIALLNAGDKTAGDAQMQKVFSMDPQQVMWRVRYVIYLESHHDLKGAVAELRDITQLFPTQAAAWNSLAMDLWQLGDVAEARQARARAVKLNPAFARLPFPPVTTNAAARLNSAPPLPKQ